MEQMEVTPVPLDCDNSDNCNMVDSSNPTTDINHIFNPCPIAITQQSEEMSSSPVNEKPTVGTNSCDDSSVPDCSASLTTIIENISLNNGISIGETTEQITLHNCDKENNMCKHDGNCKSDFCSDKVFCTKSISESANELNTECSNKKKYIMCDTDANSAGCAIVNQTNSSIVSRDHTHKIQTCQDEAIKLICKEQTDGAGKQETEIENCRSDLMTKECDKNGRPFQFNNLPKQTSEIKERVMGFLTKYASNDETSFSSQQSIQTFSKQEYVKGKESCVVGKNNIASEIVSGEQPEEHYLKKTSNNSIVQNSAESILTSSSIPKLNFASPSKDLITPSSSPYENVDLTVENRLIVSTQPTDENNQQKACTTLLPPTLSQNKFIFSVSNNNPLTSTSIPTRCKNECDHTISDTDMESYEIEDTSVSKTNMCLFQPKSEIMLNNFGLGVSQNCLQLNSELKSQVQGDCLTSDACMKDAKEMKQQKELNTSVFSSNIMPQSNKFFVTNETYSSSLQNATFPSTFNIMCVNQTTHSLQRNNSNAKPVDSWLSQERMSCQPYTTSSINSPISSSKSSNDHSPAKYALLSESALVSKLWTDKGESTVWSSKSGSKSRRTRSTDAMFCDIPNLSNGSHALFNNTNNTSQIFGNPHVVETGEIAEAHLSDFKNTDCSKSVSMMSSFAENNTNRNSHGLFGDSLGHLAYCANKETQQADNKCYESPFGSSLFKRNTDNPFIQKSPVESIGLFKSPTKSTVSGIGNSAFKPVSSSLFFIKRGNAEETTEVNCNTDRSGVLKLGASKDHSQFVFQPELKNKQDHMAFTATKFSFGNVYNHKSSVSTEMPIFCRKQSSNENIKSQSPVFSSERVLPQLSSNTTSFQFTLNPEKSKTHRASRLTWPRLPKTAIPRHEKVTLKCVKNDSPFNIVEKGPEVIPFKPAYGSDTKLEKGAFKNVIVRYQNIVFMDNYSLVSPEELRSQFYAKTVISGPFKFGASVASTCQNHSFKMTQNQETQTEEHLSPQKPDLTGIWRVLECPVCLDVVLPPVYQCEQGHHACSSCWNQVLTCPLCKRPQSGTRNYMAEALVEQVALPCRYHIEGCRETVQHNSKIGHEETCSYRMYQCPVPLCNQAHSYQNMCKHFKKHHKNVLHHEGHSVGKGEKFCDVLYKEALLSSLVHAFDITKWGLFFLREITVGLSTAFFVQVMPAASDQAVYFYHLEVCDHHDCRKECYKGRVFPMCKPTTEIIDQEEYLCLSELILKTVKKTTPLKIVVTIWQLKPAFTLSTE